MESDFTWWRLWCDWRVLKTWLSCMLSGKFERIRYFDWLIVEYAVAAWYKVFGLSECWIDLSHPHTHLGRSRHFACIRDDNRLGCGRLSEGWSCMIKSANNKLFRTMWFLVDIVPLRMHRCIDPSSNYCSVDVKMSSVWHKWKMFWRIEQNQQVKTNRHTSLKSKSTSVLETRHTTHNHYHKADIRHLNHWCKSSEWQKNAQQTQKTSEWRL